eukprot:m.150846 g.150846  ORF g.150846 m.150846 type:complete len:84 (-) comp17392_c1_seq1:283-534(-)
MSTRRQLAWFIFIGVPITGYGLVQYLTLSGDQLIDKIPEERRARVRQQQADTHRLNAALFEKMKASIDETREKAQSCCCCACG